MDRREILILIAISIGGGIAQTLIMLLITDIEVWAAVAQGIGLALGVFVGNYIGIKIAET